MKKLERANKQHPDNVEVSSYLDQYRKMVDANKAIGENVLGLLIISGASGLKEITGIKEEWFASNEQRSVFGKIKEIVIENKSNILTELVLRGEDASRMSKLMNLEGQPYSSGLDLPKHINSLERTYKKVKFFEMVEEFVVISQDDEQEPEQMISKVHAKLLELDKDEKDDVDIKSAIDEFTEMQKNFEEHEGGHGFIGVPAGFGKLDSVIDGLRPGHFWVIGGYTSTGKTWFLLNILNNVLNENRVAFFSLEMSRVDIVSRMLAVETGIGATKILRHEFADESLFDKFNKAKERLLKSHLQIYSKTVDLDELIMSMTREIIKNKTTIFAIDYIQLIKTKSKNEYEQISEASQRLQNFARENGVTILVLSQISNEHARDPNAEVMGYKGGGTLPASVDLAIELFNEDKKEERDQKVADGNPFSVKVIIKKNRHGRTGHINMDFTPWNGQFEESIFND